MGLTTTLLIYHDSLNSLNNKTYKQVFEKLIESLSRLGNVDISVESSNCVETLFKVKQTKHSSDSNLLLQHGNSLFTLNPYSEEIRNIKESNLDFFKELVSILKDNLKELKKNIIWKVF